MAKFLYPVLLFFSLATTACMTGPPPSPPTQQPSSSSVAEEQPLENEDLPSDEEDGLFYRLLAVPEYLWKGFTYPIKKMSIFYEEVDLLERALDVFLNEARTGGVFPRFEFGGALGGGVGLTAFHNNVFNKKKQVRASYIFGLPDNHAGEFSYKDPAFSEHHLYWKPTSLGSM